MIYGIYSFFDRVSQSYSEPFLAVNDSVAQRRFQYTMKNAPMVAQDMQLFKLGHMDTDKGITDVCVEFVCNYSAEVKENE